MTSATRIVTVEGREKQMALKGTSKLDPRSLPQTDVQASEVTTVPPADQKQRTATERSEFELGSSKVQTSRPKFTLSTAVGTLQRGVAAVVLGAMLIAAPGIAQADTNEGRPPAEPVRVERTLSPEASSTFKASFEAGLKEGKEKREVAAKIGMAPGQVLASSNIPIVRNVGETVKKAGQAVTSPLTILAGLVTFDGERIKNGFEDLGRGTLGVVGLEKVVMGDYDQPGGGITGALSVPSAYATKIRDAKSEWGTYSDEERNRDYEHGMKKWHTLSNAKLASSAGITELPWILLGGIAHELDPGGVSAEVNAQGFVSWMVDSPLDIVANTLGMVGGVLLPDDAHKEYARIIGNIVPGPYDPFEQGPRTDATSTTDSEKK